MNSKNKAIVAAIIFAVSMLMMELDVGGIFAFLIAVMAFFTCVLQGVMHLMGYKDGDAYKVYEDSESIEAQALSNLFKDKKRVQL
ncbi:hypothetical protein QW180_21435 [Vibrio sinaloensis]|nr:hypothetical protein [Vibrio sinaloensis]